MNLKIHVSQNEKESTVPDELYLRCGKKEYHVTEKYAVYEFNEVSEGENIIRIYCKKESYPIWKHILQFILILITFPLWVLLEAVDAAWYRNITPRYIDRAYKVYVTGDTEIYLKISTEKHFCGAVSDFVPVRYRLTASGECEITEYFGEDKVNSLSVKWESYLFVCVIASCLAWLSAIIGLILCNALSKYAIAIIAIEAALFAVSVFLAAFFTFKKADIITQTIVNSKKYE